MNEIQRQQYLDALGIDSYMPRWILPVAPAPVSCAPVLPAGNDTAPVQAVSVPSVASTVAPSTPPASTTTSSTPPSTASGQTMPVTAAPASSPESVLAAVSDVVRSVDVKTEMSSERGSEIRQPGSSTTIPVSSSAAKAPKAPKVVETIIDPRFALSLWRASENLLVIDSRHAELALPTEPLLNNILLALGFPRQSLPKAEVLRWPMYDYHLAPKGEAAARDTILAMLEGRLEMAPVSYVLLMGPEACHYILPQTDTTTDATTNHLSQSEHFAAAVGKSHRIEPLNATAIVVPSLSDMLLQPDVKAVTWKAIQPLRQG